MGLQLGLKRTGWGEGMGPAEAGQGHGCNNFIVPALCLPAAWQTVLLYECHYRGR